MRTLKDVGGLEGDQINEPQLKGWHTMRRAKMGGDHANQLTGARNQRRGLDRLNAGSSQHHVSRTSCEDRVRVDVFDDHALAGAHGHPTGGVVVAHLGEEVEKLGVEPSMSDDFKGTLSSIPKLDVPKVRPHDRRRELKDLARQCDVIPVEPEVVTDVAKPPELRDDVTPGSGDASVLRAGLEGVSPRGCSHQDGDRRRNKRVAVPDFLTT
jgi:hypothetical protein